MPFRIEYNLKDKRKAPILVELKSGNGAWSQNQMTSDYFTVLGSLVNGILFGLVTTTTVNPTLNVRGQ